MTGERISSRASNPQSVDTQSTLDQQSFERQPSLDRTMGIGQKLADFRPRCRWIVDRRCRWSVKRESVWSRVDQRPIQDIDRRSTADALSIHDPTGEGIEEKESAVERRTLNRSTLNRHEVLRRSSRSRYRVWYQKLLVCVIAQWPFTTRGLGSALISGFHSMTRAWVFLLPLDEMVVHRRVTLRVDFAGTQFYTWVIRGNVGDLKCLPQEHKAVTPARALTRTVVFDVQCTNH